MTLCVYAIRCHCISEASSRGYLHLSRLHGSILNMVLTRNQHMVAHMDQNVSNLRGRDNLPTEGFVLLTVPQVTPGSLFFCCSTLGSCASPCLEPPNLGSDSGAALAQVDSGSYAIPRLPFLRALAVADRGKTSSQARGRWYSPPPANEHHVSILESCFAP